MRVPRIAIAAGALTTIASLAAAAGPARAQTVEMAGKGHRVAYGDEVRVRGRVESGAPGRVVELQYAPRGGSYATVDQGRTERSGRFTLEAEPRESGSVRAVVDGTAGAPAPVTVSARPQARAREHIRRGGLAVVRGALRPGLASERVVVEVSRGRGWRAVDETSTASGGRFRASWRPGDTGSWKVRVRFDGNDEYAEGARTVGRVNVYRPGAASWYGPGLYGNRLGCGGTLSAGTLGVAHKTLPCGTRVTFRYGGRSVTVPVVDRGPFVGGREWDLTAATKRQLGFPSTGTVWSTK
jgi:hypothetical protein